MDLSNCKVYRLNDDWSFLSSKTFTAPSYMITFGNSLYMTGDLNVWKLDDKLNVDVLIPYNVSGTTPTYRGLYFSSNNGFLYVAAVALTEIHVFNLNLTLNHSFSTSPYQPWSITEYNNQLYVGTTNGIVLVVQNEVILKQFNGCGENNVILSSILFDQYGYFATSCNDPINKLYLIFPNGTYTGRTISTPINPRYIGFDSKGHLIQISTNETTIYN